MLPWNARSLLMVPVFADFPMSFMLGLWISPPTPNQGVGAESLPIRWARRSGSSLGKGGARRAPAADADAGSASTMAIVISRRSFWQLIDPPLSGMYVTPTGRD